MAKKNESNTDELDQLTPTEGFFDKYKNYLMIGGGAIVVIVLGTVMYQQFVTKPHIEESHDAYWNAFYEYQSNDTTELAFTGNEYFDGFEYLADEYDGTSAGEISNYAMATHSMEKGEWDNALSYLDDCDFDDVMLGTLVLGLKGDCFVELGDYDQALSQFEEAASREKNEFTTPMFLKKAGLVHEELGDMVSAVESYQKIKDNWSTSNEAKDIDKHIVRAKN